MHIEIIIGAITGIAFLAVLGGIGWVILRCGRDIDANDEDVLKQIEKWREGK